MTLAVQGSCTLISMKRALDAAGRTLLVQTVSLCLSRVLLKKKAGILGQWAHVDPVPDTLSNLIKI